MPCKPLVVLSSLILPIPTFQCSKGGIAAGSCFPGIIFSVSADRDPTERRCETPHWRRTKTTSVVQKDRKVVIDWHWYGSANYKHISSRLDLFFFPWFCFSTQQRKPEFFFRTRLCFLLRRKYLYSYCNLHMVLKFKSYNSVLIGGWDNCIHCTGTSDQFQIRFRKLIPVFFFF